MLFPLYLVVVKNANFRVVLLSFFIYELQYSRTENGHQIVVSRPQQHIALGTGGVSGADFGVF